MFSLLILLLIVLLVVGLGSLVFRQVNRNESVEDVPLDNEWATQQKEALRQRKMPFGPIAFGHKVRWIAVKANYREQVATAIGLNQLKMVNWHYGLKEAHDNHVFVTPAIKGWVLAVGLGLPDFDDGKNTKLTDLLSRLSQTFGEAHFYGSHPAVNYAAWLKYIDGKQVRGLLTTENTMLLNEGQQTGIEADLTYFHADTPDDEDNDTYPNEDLVMAIAGDWSVNPTLLEDDQFSDIEGLGTLGYLRP